jgi:hypothetical protein
VLTWLDVRFSSEVLLKEIEQSTVRISELVKAIKTYSYRLLFKKLMYTKVLKAH